MVSNGASTCMKKVPKVGGLMCIPALSRQLNMVVWSFLRKIKK